MLDWESAKFKLETLRHGGHGVLDVTWKVTCNEIHGFLQGAMGSDDDYGLGADVSLVERTEKTQGVLDVWDYCASEERHIALTALQESCVDGDLWVSAANTTAPEDPRRAERRARARDAMLSYLDAEGATAFSDLVDEVRLSSRA